MRLSLAFLALALVLPARANTRPDFDDDAKPILHAQPGLIEFVHQHFTVKETGDARTYGTDNHPPAPPYIFRAKPRGASGPYTITLLIQPGRPGHILFVKNTGPMPSRPGVSASPAPTQVQDMPSPSAARQPMVADTAPSPTVSTPAPAPVANGFRRRLLLHALRPGEIILPRPQPAFRPRPRGPVNPL